MTPQCGRIRCDCSIQYSCNTECLLGTPSCCSKEHIAVVLAVNGSLY